ncbi:hypothetical protein RIF23_13215 [Lipingzhangella sp. LS1_29]|uniref:DUF3558 domain-containing protein n=1 Tax=Lipingzhangella rawalii TaxID=2055835 RepID=A0ABU2H7G4_9ACTN|nr:hypothetical protein [Lipingzhangella rawalii]MDS1271256.1 hypothetical protein [Lipingzhangella rawalii]
MAQPPGGPPPGAPGTSGGAGEQPPGGGYGSTPHVGETRSHWRTPSGITSIILAVVAVLLLVTAALTYMWARPDPVVHERAVDCAALEVEALDELVPDAERTGDEPTAQDGYDELNCEWESRADAGGIQGYATILLRRHDSSFGWDSGDDLAAEDLEQEADNHDANPTDGIGARAYTYYDSEHQTGCVATRTDNVFLRTCYDSAEDFFDLESVSEEEAIAGGTELATAFVEHIESQEY